MVATDTRPPNPLERLAATVPPVAATGLRDGGRMAAVALLLFIATDQSYDETQVLAVAAAAVVLASFLPSAGWRSAVETLGSVFAVYAGALLFNVSAGPWVMLAGLLAVGGAMLAARARGERLLAPVVALFLAMPAITALVIAIVFVVGG